MSGNSIILIEIFTDMQLEQVSTAINYPTLPWVNQFKCYAVPFSFSYIYIYDSEQLSSGNLNILPKY